MNRRQFHRFGAAAVLSSAAMRGLLAEQFDYPWKLGVITDQVDFDLAHVLDTFYRKYALKWAEIRYLRLDGGNRYVYSDATPQQLKQLRTQLDDAGVSVSVLDTAIYKIALPGTVPIGELPAYRNLAHEKLSSQREDLKRAAEAAHALGCRRVRIFTFRRVAKPALVFDRVVQELEAALSIARQQDVTLLVENEYDCNTASGREITELFRAIPERRLMHNWDPCNSYETGETPFPTVWDQLDHSRISHIHLKDATGKEWKPIGSGKLDFLGQFRALKRIKYAGTLSVETRYRDSRQDAQASSTESMNGLLDVLKRV